MDLSFSITDEELLKELIQVNIVQVAYLKSIANLSCLSFAHLRDGNLAFVMVLRLCDKISI